MSRQMRLTFPAGSLIFTLLAPAAWAEKGVAPDGAKIVDESCVSCHGSGLMGAPKIGDSAAWQARFKNAGSVTALTETAKHGKGNMPPRGGTTWPDTTIRMTVDYMVSLNK